MADPRCSECGERVAPRRRKCDDCKKPARPGPSARQLREREARNLRAAGKTFEEIAEKIGYANASGALKAYRRSMAAAGHRSMSLEERRELELHRIDRVLDAISAEIEGGDLAAVDRFERMSKLRVRIEGMAVAPNGGGRRFDEDDEGDTSGQVVSEGTVARMRREREDRAAERAAGPHS